MNVLTYFFTRNVPYKTWLSIFNFSWLSISGFQIYRIKNFCETITTDCHSSTKLTTSYLAGDDVNDNDDEAGPKVDSSSGNVLMQTGEREQKAQFHCELAQSLNYILRNILNFGSNLKPGNILKSGMYFLISRLLNIKLTQPLNYILGNILKSVMFRVFFSPLKS